MKFLPAPDAGTGAGLPHELLVAAVLLFALAVAVWSVRHTARKSSPGGVLGIRDCRWRRTRRREGVLRGWTCRITAFTGTRRPPVECKRGLEGGL